MRMVDERAGADANVVVHVNITPRQLMTEGLAQHVHRTCCDIGADPRRLCVEITEADVLQIGPIALENLAKLRQAGIGVAIDDFGTGYSSLAHLMELPIDMLKIDRRFVKGLGLDPMATSLTTAILGLVSSMQLGCVAEGVETREQLDFLVDHRCPQMQGWLWAPALRPAEAIELVRTADVSPAPAR
jgi:EAL domain-containing protein (putative c-di-GMP-specific phosphodiesterase class I)